MPNGHMGEGSGKPLGPLATVKCHGPAFLQALGALASLNLLLLSLKRFRTDILQLNIGA